MYNFEIVPSGMMMMEKILVSTRLSGIMRYGGPSGVLGPLISKNNEHKKEKTNQKAGQKQPSCCRSSLHFAQ